MTNHRIIRHWLGRAFRPSALAGLLLAGLVAALLAPAPAPADVNQLYELAAGLANQSAPIEISTATTTKLVAAPGGTNGAGAAQAVHVTHFDAFAAGTGTFKLIAGTKTSTDCDTGATDLTGAYALVAQTAINVGNGFGAVLTVPAGDEVCAVTSAAVSIQGSIAWRVY